MTSILEDCQKLINKAISEQGYVRSFHLEQLINKILGSNPGDRYSELNNRILRDAPNDSYNVHNGIQC